MRKLIDMERRSNTRFPIELNARCINNNSFEETLTRTYDICPKGVGLITTSELEKGTPISVFLTMPDTGEEIRVKGRVIWQSMVDEYKYRVGINLEGSHLMPVQIALRTLQSRVQYH